jgi:hypothetical protein
MATCGIYPATNNGVPNTHQDYPTVNYIIVDNNSILEARGSAVVKALR